jgi:hypothetical protein
MPESYAPLDGRRQAVTIVFAGIVLVSAVAVVGDVLELQLLNRLVAGESVTEAEATGNDSRQSLIGLVQLATAVAGAIVFIRWLRLAYRNVDVVAPDRRRYGHGWAIGSWFVPILNLWRPKQIVNDVWRAGGRDAAHAEPGGLLVLWWLAFLISNWIGGVAARIYISDDTAEELRNGTVAYLISDGIDVLAALLAILVVRAASDRLDDRAASMPEPGPQAPEGGLDAPERPAGVPA